MLLINSYDNKNGIMAIRKACITCLCLYVNYAVSNDLFMVIFLITSCILILFSNYTESLIYLLVFSSFSQVIKFTNNGIYFYFIIICVFILAASFRNRVKINKAGLVLYVLFLMYCFLTFDKTFTDTIISNIITLIYYFAILIIATNYRYENFEKYVIAHSCGFFLASTLGLFINRLPKPNSNCSH